MSSQNQKEKDELDNQLHSLLIFLRQQDKVVASAVTMELIMKLQSELSYLEYKMIKEDYL